MAWTQPGCIIPLKNRKIDVSLLQDTIFRRLASVYLEILDSNIVDDLQGVPT